MLKHQKPPNDELVTFSAFNKTLAKIFLHPAIKAALTAVYFGAMRIFSSYLIFAEHFFFRSRDKACVHEHTAHVPAEKRKPDDDETRTMKSGYEKYANHFGIKGLS